jgi:hypothetical protein
MVFRKESSEWTHLGSKMEQGVIKMSDETILHASRLIVSQVQDAVKTFTSIEYLSDKLSKIRAANNQIITEPMNSINNLVKLVGLPPIETDLLNYFIDGGDRSLFGLSQALTAAAYDYSDADVALQLEGLGTDVLFNKQIAEVLA